MAENNIPRFELSNSILWNTAKRLIMAGRSSWPHLKEHQKLGDNWPNCLQYNEIAIFQYGLGSDKYAGLCFALKSAIKNNEIAIYDTKVHYDGTWYFIHASTFQSWLKGKDKPSEIIQDWFNVWAETNDFETQPINQEDAILGKNERQRRIGMASLRHIENEARKKYWEPFIDEGNKLLLEGYSKNNAAITVSNRYPKDKINSDTLRQKLGKT